MGKYTCGSRSCTDEELDMIEKVRAGESAVIQGSHLADIDSIGERIEEAVSKLGPNLQVSGEALAEAVSSAIAEHPIQLVDTHSYEEHLKSCPNCQELEDQRFKRNFESKLPELASQYGYQIKPATEPEAEAKEPVPEVKAEEPAPAPAPATEPEPEEQEEEDGLKGTLSRIYKEHGE